MSESLPLLPDEPALNLRSERLDFLPINRSYAPAMYAVLNDLELYEFTGGQPPANVEELSVRYEGWESRRAPDGSELWLNWVLREREDVDLIGWLQAGVAVDHATMAWVIGSRWQGRGFASEAAVRLVEWLVDLGVSDIRASIHPGHVASIRVAERAGLARSDLVSDVHGEAVWRVRLHMASGVHSVGHDRGDR